MTDLAFTLLKKLLLDAEKNKAGVKVRNAAITMAALESYHSNRNIQDREAFEAYMQAAQDNGAVNLKRERGYHIDGRMERVDLTERGKLALFLGISTQDDLLSKARASLSGIVEEFHVLNEVLENWRQLKKVRGTGPKDVQDWLNAAFVIQYMKKQPDTVKGELPIREVSAYLFKDSKVIEKISSLLDVLLSGSTESIAREPYEIWAEIGLRREEQPVRLAGKVIIRRERVCSVLDSPYTAFPAATVLNIESSISNLITIENQTTFHTEARRLHDNDVLLIYTAGMPSPAWRAMYSRILSSISKNTSILHWGDVDEGGFRIAALISELAKASGHTLKPYRMSPEDVPLEKRRPATEKTLVRMRHYAEKAGWVLLADSIFESGFTVEQEAL